MIYPTVVKQFKVYQDTDFLIGNSDITLPKLTFEKDTLKGAGIAGSLNLPVPGNVSPMECSMNFHTNTKQSLGLFVGKAGQIRCLSSLEVYDTSMGEYDEYPEEIIMTVLSSEYDNNKREPSVKGVVAVRLDVTYLALYFNGALYWQIDPFNDVCIVNGVDLNSKTRANVG